MIAEFEAIAVPLETNEQGVIRVVGTRVSLNSILHAYYQEGAIPEEIALRFPSCSLESIYTIISWALSHPDFVARYLASQTTQRNQLEKESKQRYATTALRERLLARRQQKR